VDGAGTPGEGGSARSVVTLDTAAPKGRDDRVRVATVVL